MKHDKLILTLAQKLRPGNRNPMLDRVRFEPATGRAVITDGHRLAIVERQADEDEAKREAFHLPAQAVAKCKIFGAVEQINDDTARVKNGSQSAHLVLFEHREAKYPDYQEVIPPDLDNRPIGGFQVKYLKDALDAAHAAKARTATLHVGLHGTLEIRAGLPDGGTLRVYTMPLLSDLDTGEKLPTWTPCDCD